MDTAARAPLILVIDDDPDLVEALIDTLEYAGNYRVISAKNGSAGLEAVVEHHPDCVVVDVRMPQINGLQFVRAMRGDPATTSIPIVMLSAMVQREDELHGLFSGADAYLRKPVRIVDLLTAIQHAIGVSDEQRAQQVQRFAQSAGEHADDHS